VPPVEYIVPALGIARNTITLWTGADGDGKTYLAQNMAISVARGELFLGMRCLKSPVLYVDLENPAYVVQDRLRPMTEEQSISDLRFWGIWNEQQPPTYGSELLLTMARETKPLIIVDPFRYFHSAKENVSDEMGPVIQYLRACVRFGGAVVILHHPAKTEGSTGRGAGGQYVAPAT
jgi:RecA-family ATPase